MDKDWGVLVQFPAEVKNFFHTQNVQTFFQPTQPTFSQYLELIFAIAYRSEPVTDHLSSSTAEVKYTWSYNFKSPKWLHTDKLTYYLV
jgi:hypothetical protein